MIEEIQGNIIDQLSAIVGVATVGAWQGDIEELLKTPQKMPSLHVLYQGADFDPLQNVGAYANAAMDFIIVLMVQNQKSRTEGSLDAYAVIEAVRGKLIGHAVRTNDQLRPVREDLITARGGILVYGMIYRAGAVDVTPA
ncbi:MAG: Gp37 family protein [Syntrophales bacterium]